MSALRIVISVLEERGDTAGLARLEAALPEESEARGAAQESLVAAKLAQLHAVWAAGGQLEAWVRRPGTEAKKPKKAVKRQGFSRQGM